MYPYPTLAPVPNKRHLVAKSDTILGQLDIWSAFGSAWHLVSLWVRLTCGKMYPLPPHTCTPLLPHAPLPLPSHCFGDILWLCLVLFWAGWPLVRCTPKHPIPMPLMTHCAPFHPYIPSPPHTPPCRDISWPSVLLLWAGWPLVRLFPIAFLNCD